MSSISTRTEMIVPYSLLERAEKHSSTASLDISNPAKSKGKVFSWNGKNWTCTGTIGQYLRLLQVDIREVVPADQYAGPPNDPSARGSDFYLGGKFTCNGQAWVMTSNIVILKPAENSGPTQQPEQLSLFK